MGWTSPITWTPGQVVTATDLNAQVRDDLGYLLARPSGGILRDNGANYTTSSSTFVDIDGTNLSLQLTISGSKVLLGFTGIVRVTNNPAYFDFTVDGSRLTSPKDGLATQVSGSDTTVTLLALVTGLSAGAHTFKVQWGVGSGTATLRAGSGNSYENYLPSFLAIEVG